MPLYKNAPDLICANFEETAKGNKPKGVVIGVLTNEQLASINQARAARFPPHPPGAPPLRVFAQGWETTDLNRPLFGFLSGRASVTLAGVTDVER
jgi:hypothetical protein